MKEDNDNFIQKQILNNNNNLISIETNKEFYYKDETVEGRIIFDCLSTITLNDISVSLYLKENWIIQETATVKYGEKNNVLLSKFDLGLNNFSNDNNEIKTILPGRYVFLFKMEIPNFVPPSFEYPMPNREAYLRYSLEAEIISKDVKLKKAIYLLIKSVPKKLDTPKSYTAITNVHKWGMFDGGNTILKVSNVNNNYNIDEIVPLTIEIDNTRGKLRVKNCKIRIIRTIEFSRLDKSLVEKYPLEKTIYSNVFWAEVLPHSKRSFVFQIELKDKDFVDFNYWRGNNPYPNIKDINILLPSIEGKILKCEYRIQVSLYFDCFVTFRYRPRVCIPIFIIHKPVEKSDDVKLENENNSNKDMIIYNNNNNYSCDSSSLLYDQKYLEKINNENDKSDYYENSKDNMIIFNEYEKKKNFEINKNDQGINNKKSKYIELNEDQFCSINDF